MVVVAVVVVAMVAVVDVRFSISPSSELSAVWYMTLDESVLK